MAPSREWELFKKERPKTTADEIIRWAAPVTSFHRTALEDTELGGAQFKVPRDVVFLDELPRNATGKLLRQQLIDMDVDT